MRMEHQFLKLSSFFLVLQINYRNRMIFKIDSIYEYLFRIYSYCVITDRIIQYLINNR